MSQSIQSAKKNISRSSSKRFSKVSQSSDSQDILTMDKNTALK